MILVGLRSPNVFHILPWRHARKQTHPRARARTMLHIFLAVLAQWSPPGSQTEQKDDSLISRTGSPLPLHTHTTPHIALTD